MQRAKPPYSGEFFSSRYLSGQTYSLQHIKQERLIVRAGLLKESLSAPGKFVEMKV